MKLTSNKRVRNCGELSRRGLLNLPLAAGALALGHAVGAPRKDEYDPDNTKIATMVSVRATDDELLFWKQIGLRWVHLEFGQDAPYEVIKGTQERLARYGLKIHCGILDAFDPKPSSPTELGLNQDCRFSRLKS